MEIAPSGQIQRLAYDSSRCELSGICGVVVGRPSSTASFLSQRKHCRCLCTRKESSVEFGLHRTLSTLYGQGTPRERHEAIHAQQSSPSIDTKTRKIRSIWKTIPAEAYSALPSFMPHFDPGRKKLSRKLKSRAFSITLRSC